MKTLFDLPIALLSLGIVTASADTNEIGGCPQWSTGVPIPSEHSDDACDLYQENDPVRRNAEREVLFVATRNGRLQLLQDEKTWVCPEDNSGLAAEDSPSAFTLKTAPATKWMLRNRSSNPVAVALVDRSRRNKEVSAMNPKVYPPHHDPEAILQPGQRAVVDTTLGAILHVRELVRVGDVVVPGQILIRHRPGPMTVGENFMPDAATGDSSVASTQEAEPANECMTTKHDTAASASPRKAVSNNPDQVQPQKTILNKAVSCDSGVCSNQELSPSTFTSADRGPLGDRRCNSISKIFANRSGRPLDVYYAGAVDVGRVAPTDHDSTACNAENVFSLGTDATTQPDFLFSPETNMFAENTYIGHKFVARLRSDPSTVVEEIVLERTEVYDCARERKTTAGSESKVVSIAADVLRSSREEQGSEEYYLDKYDDIVGNSTQEFDAALVNVSNFVLGGVEAPVAKIMSPGRTGEVISSASGSLICE